MSSMENGMRLFAKGDWNEALIEFNGIVRGNIKDSAAWRFKGAICEIRKHLMYDNSLSSMAEYCFEMALLADQSEAVAWAYTSVHRNDEGELSESQQHLDKFYKAAGDNQIELETGRGVMDFAHSNYSSAKDHFKKALKMDSENLLARGFMTAIDMRTAQDSLEDRQTVRAEETV